MFIVLLFLSIVTGVIFSMSLYLRDKKSGLLSKQRIFLSVCRGLSITIIVLLLCSFVYKTKQRIIEKPIIVIVSDNSSSIISQSDSLYFKEKHYSKDIKKLKNELQKHADVFIYEFDNELRNNISYSYTGEQTNLNQAIESILQRYEGRNISGMILATDGIVNTGGDPSVLAERLYFPLYAVGMGDTSSYADISIKNLRYNKSVVYGNRYPVEVVIHASDMKGKKTFILVKQNSKEVVREEIRINSEVFSEKRSFIFEANKKDINKIEFQIIPLKEEKNTANNYATAYVNVIEKKIKLGILFHAPHPDITAIKSSLEKAKNYSIDLLHTSTFNTSEIPNYDALILFHIPDKRHRTNITEQVINSQTPYLLVVGQNTDLRQLSSLRTGLKLQQTSTLTQEVFPIINPDFSLFEISPELQNNIRYIPPLITFYGNYSLTEYYHQFIQQQIGNIHTTNPILAFSTEKNQINSVFFGEGLFKWKLYDYLKTGTHYAFDEIIQKTINLLVLKEDKRRLRINHKDVYYSTENAEITAEVYNRTMEMITTPDVNISIIHNNKTQRDFTFIPQISNYRLNLGKLKPGEYSWTATSELDKNVFETKGMFFVENISIENLNTKADHNILKFISEKSGGKFFSLKQINEIHNFIKKFSELNSLEYFSEKSDELISLKWILFLLILLLSTEWAFRKFFGSF